MDLSAQEKRYIGVDVGGTKILALVVTGDGEILSRFKQRVRKDDTHLVDQISAAIDAAIAQVGPEMQATDGIGLGVPAVVDSQNGLIVHAPNLKIDDPEPAKRLSERYPVPVALGNDVNLGTFAECWLGAGRDAETVVGIFVGTGIGGGLVVDGRLRTGPEDVAGEVGHMPLLVDGPECGCGNLGCFEALASRTALVRKLQQEMEQGRTSRVTDFIEGERITSGALAAALEAEDELVTEIMRQEAHYLAQGALAIRHIVDPDVIIFGGGLMEACGHFLLPLIEGEIRQDKLRSSRDVLRIVLSQLADDAVALGAVALVQAEASGLALTEFPVAGGIPEPANGDAPAVPHIDSVTFGVVVVACREFPHDICIRAGEKVRKRSKKHARRQYGTSHVVDRTEIEKLCKGLPRNVIIGSGFHGMLRLTDDAREYLETSGAHWQVLPTPQAVAAYNRAFSPKALLLHVTC